MEQSKNDKNDVNITAVDISMYPLKGRKNMVDGTNIISSKIDSISNRKKLEVFLNRETKWDPTTD